MRFLDHTQWHKHSVGLLWTRDRPVAEISTWKHKTPIGDRHPYPGGIRTRVHSKRAAADPCLRPRGHWCRHTPINLAVFLLIVYPTLIPFVGGAILFCWGTKSSDFMVDKLSVTLTSLSKYQSIDIQHRSFSRCWGTRQNLQTGTIAECLLNLCLCSWNVSKSEFALAYQEHLWGNAFISPQFC